MQASTRQLTKKLRNTLKNYLNNEFITDIFIIGSLIKDKFEPRDMDLIVLFRCKDYKKIENLLYEIKNSIKGHMLHVEPLIIDDFFNKSISSTILFEGISLKNNSSISDMLNFYSYSLFTFSLSNLSNIQKVRFAQTVYGRKNNGLIKTEEGKMLGKGAFIVPVNKEELFKEVFNKFNVKADVTRIIINKSK